MSDFYQKEFEERMKQNMQEVKSLLASNDEQLISKIQLAAKRYFIGEEYIYEQIKKEN